MKKSTNKDIENKNIEIFTKEISIEEVYKRYELFEVEAEIIKEYFKDKGEVLDLGCGRGRTTAPLYNMGYEVVGIDPSEEMIKAAKQDFPEIDFSVGNACELEFENNEFDYVFFSFNGIDYIYPEERRIKALKEIFRVLKPEGLFVFSSHNSRYFIPHSLLDSLIYLPKFYFINLLQGNLYSKYRIDPAREGYLTIYQIAPFKQQKQLEKIGFKLIDVKTRHFKKYFKRFDPWPYYIAKKGL